MKTKSMKTLIAILLIMVLTMANFMLLITESYAAYKELESQGKVSNQKNVEYDAYFKKEDAKQHYTGEKIGDTVNLYMQIAVKNNGYLKDGKIQIQDPNFSVAYNAANSNVIREVNAANNEISLNQIGSGEEVELVIPVTFQKQDQMDLSYFGKTVATKLTGTYKDENGKEKAVEKEVQVRMDWNTEMQMTATQQVEKYIPVQVDGQNKVMLETSIKANIVNNQLPMEKAEMIAQIPTINGIKAEEIKLYAVNQENEFTVVQEQEQIKITTQNIASNNQVAWGSGNLEYRMVAIYPETAKADKVVVHTKLETAVKAYAQANAVAVQEEKDTEVRINTGSVVTNLVTTTPELNKGYLYVNNGYETNYETKWETEISYAKVVEKLTMEATKDQYSNEKEEKTEADTKYKTTSITKENFDKMLGQEGRIEIYDQNNNKVGEINNSTQANEKGRLEITYSEEVNQVRVVTTKPQTEGRIEIVHQKAIKGNTNKTTPMIKQYTKLATQVATKGENQVGVVAQSQAEAQTILKENETYAEVTMSQPKLSTVVNNENVEIRAILRTDDSSKDLYQNPTLEIELPREVQEVNIKAINLLFSNELKVKSYEVRTNSNGNKVIYVAVEGNQTQYTTDLNQGVHVVINTDLRLDQLAGSADSQVTMRYTNQKAVRLNNDGIATTNVAISAPTGIVALNSVSNYANQKPEVVSFQNKEEVAQLETATETKIATMKLTVLNNNEKDVQNPKILGRLPFNGNTKTTGEALGTNIDTKLTSVIETNGLEKGSYTVYYSENGTANDNIEDSQNGWTTNKDALSTIKSYLIVTNGYNFTKGSAVDFDYQVAIPENLTHNQSAYGTYTVYYDNAQADGQTMKENVVAPTVGMTTGEGPVMEANLSSSAKDTAKTSQIMNYTVTIKNTGAAAEGTKITIPVPQGTNYAEFVKGDGAYQPDEYVQKPEVRIITIDVGNIAKDAIISKTFAIVATQIGEIEVKASISANNLEKAMETPIVKTKIEQGYFQVSLNNVTSENIGAGKTVQYVAEIQNISSTTAKNVKVVSKIDENLTYQEAYVMVNGNKVTEGITYNETDRTVAFSIGEIATNQLIEVSISAKANTLGDKENSKQAKTAITVTADGIAEHQSNEVITNIKKVQLDKKVTTNVESGYVKVGDRLDYTVKVTNVGTIDAENIKISVNLPENLKYLNTKYTLLGKTVEGYILEGNQSKIEVSIPVGQTVEMIVETTVKRLEDSGSNEDINTGVDVETPDGEKDEEDIEHKVDDEQGPDENGKYKVSGTAWLDENRDGQKEESEKRISEMKVTAMNAETGKIAQNENAENITATTDKDGNYTLKGLDKGAYIVLFDYDTKQYSLTEYQKEGVAENKNSDAILTKVGGETPREAAVSDTLTIEKVSKANIDIGLMQTSTFDLAIDKTVNKITVQNQKGTQTKTYDNEKLAKIDLDGKYISGTNLIVEYKIVVTNKGTVEGYAKKIIDYMPKELKFSSELNKDWYLTGENLMNNSLGNEKIKPGESKEITLVLTKKMAEDGNGIVNNTAEIQEAYNDYGLEDINSTPGNKQDGENDMSSADVIIGLKTGSTILYIALTTSILIAIGAGAYFVNKKVLKM